MECDKVRAEFPHIHFRPCCESCHEDSNMGAGNDLWFEIGGEERNVCCAVINSIQRHGKELDRKQF